jgi:hypothetical protein
MVMFWSYLSGYTSLQEAAGDTLQCFTHLPGLALSADAAAMCNNLLAAGIKSMLVYPAAIFITGGCHSAVLRACTSKT